MGAAAATGYVFHPRDTRGRRPCPGSARRHPRVRPDHLSPPGIWTGTWTWTSSTTVSRTSPVRARPARASRTVPAHGCRARTAAQGKETSAGKASAAGVSPCPGGCALGSRMVLASSHGLNHTNPAAQANPGARGCGNVAGAHAVAGCGSVLAAGTGTAWRCLRRSRRRVISGAWPGGILVPRSAPARVSAPARPPAWLAPRRQFLC